MTNCPPTCLAAQPLATDFERGRHLMLSSQSISPRRWFTYRLSVPATALLVSSTALSVTVRWGSHWLHPASGPGADLGQWSSALDFDALAPVYPMLTLTAFALGALVGLLLHRAIPALGLTFLLYAALGWGLEQVRPFLLPLHLVVGQVDASMSDSSWIYDEGVVLNGRRVSYQACMDGGCHGAPAWVRFHRSRSSARCCGSPPASWPCSRRCWSSPPTAACARSRAERSADRTGRAPGPVCPRFPRAETARPAVRECWHAERVSTVLETPVPRPARVATGSTLIATVVPGRGLLGRLAAVLSAHPIQALALRTPSAGPAVVEITVTESHRARVRAKLLRMVDVLDVVDGGEPA